MVNGIVTDATGNPVDGNGNVLTKSKYNPSDEVKKLFQQVQGDYLAAYTLQNRSFDEFDQMSLLQRTTLDQQTFGAFVGASWQPAHKSWRWKGRKNTARNKIIGILSHVLSGMLFPYVYAYNEDNEEEELTAKVMSLLIENHLKKAGYEMKFLFMMCSALVNPAVFIEVEYIEAMQRIKQRGMDGKIEVLQVVDELLSGTNLNIIPVDSLLLGDFYTFDIQRQPYIARVRRISYDEAREIYAGKYFVDGKDQFDYVVAGQTRIVPSGTNNQTLYDIDWTIGDINMVQEITMYYKGEDLEATFVGGVFFGEDKDVYNSNPFKHRRLSMIKDKYVSIPVYPFAKSGFEPLDPSGRFAYYKSAAFKEYWDDASLNRMYQLAQDGTFLDVFKPMFIDGISSVDSINIAPGVTVGMPAGAKVTPYALGPNINMALKLMQVNDADLSLSTQDALQSGMAQPGVTATASLKAEQNAQVIMVGFSTMIVDLLKQLGGLVTDDIIAYTTVGEVDATIPESLNMKYKKFRVQGKNDDGKDITHAISFNTNMMSPSFNDSKASDLEWKMFENHGGMEAKTIEYQVNPYKFARVQYTTFVDPQQIISRSMGTDKLRQDRAVQMMTNPAILPYINMQEVVKDFVVKDYSNGDPDKYIKTDEQRQQEQQQQMQGMQQGGQQPQPNDQLANSMFSQPAMTH